MPTLSAQLKITAELEDYYMFNCFLRINGRTHKSIVLKHLPRKDDILKLGDFEEYTVVSIKFLLNNLPNIQENRIDICLKK